MEVLSNILACRAERRPLLAVLLDPEKAEEQGRLLPLLGGADLVFVGGSTGATYSEYIAHVRQYTSRPIVLFPGNVGQFAPNADALLFISLLTARTGDVLIEPHIESAMAIRESGIETIPLGYILVDGGRASSVEKATHSVPLSQEAKDEIVRTAVAGELLGKQMIYLEAGSGAKRPVAADIVRAVREHIHVPLIVGGGICSMSAMLAAYESGADIVVIGNHFEQKPEELPLFVDAKNVYARSDR